MNYGEFERRLGEIEKFGLQLEDVLKRHRNALTSLEAENAKLTTALQTQTAELDQLKNNILPPLIAALGRLGQSGNVVLTRPKATPAYKLNRD